MPYNNCCDDRYDVHKKLNEILAQLQAQAQVQKQYQKQYQYQEAKLDADQDQDQKLKSIFKEIGNNKVYIKVDNESVAVAVLAWLGYLSGGLSGDQVREYMDKVMSKSGSDPML